MNISTFLGVLYLAFLPCIRCDTPSGYPHDVPMWRDGEHMDHEPSLMDGDCISAYKSSGMEPSSMPMRDHHGRHHMDHHMMDRDWEAQQ